MIFEFLRGSNEQITPHFKAREFDCKCGRCDITRVSLELVELLEKMRVIAAKTIVITSAYRCRKHQDALRESGLKTAKNLSTHELGQAVDIKVPGWQGARLEKLARKVGFKAVGVGATWVHVDLRKDKERRWFY